MGLFSKFSKKGALTNAIENQALKKELSDQAISQLKAGEDYAEMAYTTCDFGYVFASGDQAAEALFKVVTDRTTVYFAVQKGKLSRMQLNGEMYKNTVKAFLDLHP